MHGEAFNEGPRQAAVLMHGTGRVHFPITAAHDQHASAAGELQLRVCKQVFAREARFGNDVGRQLCRRKGRCSCTANRRDARARAFVDSRCAVLDRVDAHEHDQVELDRRGCSSDHQRLDLNGGKCDGAAALSHDFLAQRRALRSRTRDQYCQVRERRYDLRNHG
jgi:hypothetical protein